MIESEIKEKLNGVFRQVFHQQDLVVTEEMSAKDVKGWDSLNHVTLIFAVEKAFKIRIATREVQGLKNVGDLIRLIAAKAA